MYAFYFLSLRLLPILRVISKGVSNDKSPIDILKDIIVQLEKTGKKNKNKNNETRLKKKKKKATAQETQKLHRKKI